MEGILKKSEYCMNLKKWTKDNKVLNIINFGDKSKFWNKLCSKFMKIGKNAMIHKICKLMLQNF